MVRPRAEESRRTSRLRIGLQYGYPMRTGDVATGTTVLEDLYAQLRDRPVSPDLMALWRSLGVEADRTSVALNDAAPLAGVRQAIMHAH